MKKYIIGDKISVIINNEEKFLEYCGISDKFDSNGDRKGKWLCYCGEKFNCRNAVITNGHTKSCGHNIKIYIIGEIVQVKIKKEIKELKYLGDTDKRNKYKKIIGKWLCFCGNKFECVNADVTRSHTKSCGENCWIKKFNDYSNTDLIKCIKCLKLLTKDNFRWANDGKIRSGVGYKCSTCHKKHKNNYEKERRKNDPIYKLRTNISKQIGNALKDKNNTKTSSTFKLLGYTPEELKKHLEIQWETWMTWENYGRNPKIWNKNDQSTWVWNIDHIIPHSTFNYTSDQDNEFKECWSLENLRPYPANQNSMDGGSKIRHK